jgi:hypothetical protein
VGQYQSELNRSPNKMSKGTIEKELIDGLNYVTEGTFLTPVSLTFWQIIFWKK